MERYHCRVTIVALLFASTSILMPVAAQPTPDLFISTVPAEASEAIRGQEDTVSITIGNNGSSATATTFDVTIYLSADETPSSIEKAGDVAVSVSLGIGETRSLNVPVRVPSLQTLGEHLWLVKVYAAERS